MRTFLHFLKKQLIISMSSIGTMWTLLEICESLYAGSISDSVQKCLLLLSAVFWPLLLLIYENCFFSCPVGHSCTLRIRLGSILRKKRGAILVNINNELLEHGVQFKSESLHGRLLHGKDRRHIFFSIVSEREKFQALKTAPPIGHHFDVFTSKQHFLFLVASRLNRFRVPETTPGDLLTALHTLFSEQSSLHIGSRTLYTPVIGTTSCGINISYDEAIESIAREYIICCEDKDPNSPNRIQTLEIVIPWKDRIRIRNWSETCSNIRTMTQLCGSCLQLKTARNAGKETP